MYAVESGIGLGLHVPHEPEVGVADRADMGDQPPDEIGVDRRVLEPAQAVLHEGRDPSLEHLVVVEDVRAVERRRLGEVGTGPDRRLRQHRGRQVSALGDVAQPAGVHPCSAPVGPAEHERAVGVDAGGGDRVGAGEIARFEHRLVSARFQAVPVDVLGEPERVGGERGAVGPGAGRRTRRCDDGPTRAVAMRGR